MKKEDLLAIIRENLAEDGKLFCAKAYQLAEAHDIKLWQIGQICEDEKIKIKGCQLGCF